VWAAGTGETNGLELLSSGMFVGESSLGLNRQSEGLFLQWGHSPRNAPRGVHPLIRTRRAVDVSI
jgi:hypothetical protein